MNPDVDAYIDRSDRWTGELGQVRQILLEQGLDEQIKWGKPCYAHNGSNIAILQEMKDFLALMFFKGALLPDPDGVLEEQGPNSRSARRIRITSTSEVTRLSDTIASYLRAAVEVEESGRVVAPAPPLDPVPELRERLERDPMLRAAFAALTPGRRREYDLYIGGAKRPETRAARVDKCVPLIMDGRGLRDRS